jgi:hypothetical protein
MLFKQKVLSCYCVKADLSVWLSEDAEKLEAILKKNGFEHFKPSLKVKTLKQKNWLALYRSGSAIRSRPIFWVGDNFIDWCDKHGIVNPTDPLLDTLLHEMWHAMADLIRFRCQYQGENHKNPCPEETDKGQGEEDAAEKAISPLYSGTFKDTELGKIFLEALEWDQNKREVNADYDAYRNKAWIHYSSHEQMKFNYQSRHNDPVGIYFFPEGFRTEGSWHTLPYKFTAKLKPEAHVLDLAKVNTKEDSLKLIDALEAKGSGKAWDEFIKKHDPEANYAPEHFKYIDHAWEWLKNFYMGRKATFTKRLLAAGYYAIFDDTNSIFHGETQLIVLNPKMLTDIKQTTQGETGYKEVAKAREIILDVLKNYDGKLIFATRPKKKKGFANDPSYVECQIHFGHDESTRSFEGTDGKTISYPVYGREITFKIKTSTFSMSGEKKRPATEISVTAEGTSEAYKKHTPSNWGEAKHSPLGLNWRLEEFNPADIIPWAEKTMKMLWDDEEPAKQAARWEKEKQEREAEQQKEAK